MFFHRISRKISSLRLRHLSGDLVSTDKSEVRLFCIFKNESLRLPYFFEYYKNLGVDRFFMIDNGSTDDSLKICQSFSNVCIFQTSEPYTCHWNWMEELLDEYGVGHWCLVVDVDEILHYPHSDKLDLKQLRDYLESKNESAMHCVLLDMYSNKAIVNTNYQQGEDPHKLCLFFDRQYDIYESSHLNKKTFQKFQFSVFLGGLRARVFGLNRVCLSKVSFFHASSKAYLCRGMHAIDGVRLSSIRGAVFHFKYFSDFLDNIDFESKFSSRRGLGVLGNEYDRYAQVMREQGQINFHNEFSVKYENDNQLVNLGVMTTTEEFENYCVNLDLS